MLCSKERFLGVKSGSLSFDLWFWSHYFSGSRKFSDFEMNFPVNLLDFSTEQV